MYRSRLDGSGIVALNQRLADIFGFTKEEMMASPATIRWADPRAREEMVRLLREHGELRDHEIDIVTKGGEVRTVLASMKLYPGEGYLEGTAIDITERKRAEEALRAERATPASILRIRLARRDLLEHARADHRRQRQVPRDARLHAGRARWRARSIGST